LQLQQAAAIKHKTSPARLAQLLQRTGRYAVIGCKLKQNANESCNSCAIVVQVLQDLFCFIASFILLVIGPLHGAVNTRDLGTYSYQPLQVNQQIHVLFSPKCRRQQREQSNCHQPAT